MPYNKHLNPKRKSTNSDYIISEFTDRPIKVGSQTWRNHQRKGCGDKDQDLGEIGKAVIDQQAIEGG